METEKVTTETE